MIVLVIGGTGTLGRQIVKRALDEGYTIKCLVRDFRRSIFLRDWGSYLVYGDLATPSSIPLAFKSVHIVVDSATSRLFSNYNYAKVDGFGKLAILEISKFVQIKKYIVFTILISGPKNNYWCNKNEKFTLLLGLTNQFRAEILQKVIAQKNGIYKKKIVYIVFQCLCFFQGLITEYAIPILEDETIWVPAHYSCFNYSLPYIDTRDVAKSLIQTFNCSDYNNTFVIILTSFTYNLSTTYVPFPQPDDFFTYVFMSCIDPTFFTTYEIITLCECLAGKKAKFLIVPDLVFTKLETLFRFFQITKQIADTLKSARLITEEVPLIVVSFLDKYLWSNFEKYVLNNKPNPEVGVRKIFVLDNPLELKIYLADYFIQMLKKLREINYQDQKSDKISFL